MIYYVSIGNSDDKLSQFEWGRFHHKTDLVIQGYRRSGMQVLGQWVSPSAAYWQNACWCIDDSQAGATLTNLLKNELGELAARFGQESIAWAVVAETEFLSLPEES